MKLKTNLTKEEIKNIEDVINYTFNNKEILQTAFTRKTFAAENQVMSNEMYEYVGDTAIDFVINKYNVMQRIYYIDNKPVEFNFEKGSTEDQLTQLKQKIVSTENLAKSMDCLSEEFDLMKCMLVNQGDINNNIYENDKIKADLFESIVGAITVDSNWNMTLVAEILLGNDVKMELLENKDIGIQTESLYSEGILYNNTELSGIAKKYISNFFNWYNRNYKENPSFIYNKIDNIYECQFEMTFEEKTYVFNGKGNNKKTARNICIQQAHDKFIEEIMIEKQIEEYEQGQADKMIEDYYDHLIENYYQKQAEEYIEKQIEEYEQGLSEEMIENWQQDQIEKWQENQIKKIVNKYEQNPQNKFQENLIEKYTSKYFDLDKKESNMNNAVNNIQEMYQAKFILEPMYIFNTTFDENGNPIWYVTLSVVYDNRYLINIETNKGYVSKKEAKKTVAYYFNLWFKSIFKTIKFEELSDNPQSERENIIINNEDNPANASFKIFDNKIYSVKNYVEMNFKDKTLNKRVEIKNGSNIYDSLKIYTDNGMSVTKEIIKIEKKYILDEISLIIIHLCICDHIESNC